jgi:alkylhydroperoxidase family enzyme
MEEEGGAAKVAQLAEWRASALFEDAEKAALDYAEHMTITGERVDDAQFARLKRHFSEAQIVELSAVVALENFRSKFNPALAIAAQGFCPIPQRDPG